MFININLIQEKQKILILKQKHHGKFIIQQRKFSIRKGGKKSKRSERILRKSDFLLSSHSVFVDSKSFDITWSFMVLLANVRMGIGAYFTRRKYFWNRKRLGREKNKRTDGGGEKEFKIILINKL